jgi:ribokinase
MVGQVGNDTHGEWLKQHLAAQGVDVSHLKTDAAAPTGTAIITIDSAGQNRIVIVPGANGSLGLEQLKPSEALIASAAIVLLQLEIPLATVVRAAQLAKQGGALVILDPAPASVIGLELLQSADYVTPNETELATLTGVSGQQPLVRSDAVQSAGKLLALGARRVVLKMGSLGAVLVSEQEPHFWPAIPVEVVDTTAAGDAFNAAYAVALAAGQSEVEAGYFATAAAACSVTRPGAQPSMPSREEVETLLAKSRP